MTGYEILAYCEENNLMHDLANAMVNNKIGFAYLIIENAIVKKDGNSVYFLCPGDDGTDIQFPVEIEDKKMLSKAINHPEHCQAVVMQMGDQYVANLQYSRSGQAIEALSQETMLEFIKFANITTINELMRVLHIGYALYQKATGDTGSATLMRDWNCF